MFRKYKIDTYLMINNLLHVPITQIILKKKQDTRTWFGCDTLKPKTLNFFNENWYRNRANASQT